MTTTELIAFLKKYERGGATGKSREISLSIRLIGKRPKYIENPVFEFGSCGDGLITDLCILISDEESE